MELVNNLVNNQFFVYVPVALVLVIAILVFTFGFKTTEQPPFEKIAAISTDDRKTSSKKKKLKEKKPTSNGHVVHVAETKAERSPTKEIKKPSDAPKKSDNAPKQAEKKKMDNVKNRKVDVEKKTVKPKVSEKPVDYDDAGWETVPSKGEKKKKQDSPAKKEKKPKKVEKSIAIEKLVKDVINKELQEKEKSNEVATPIAAVPITVQVTVVNKLPEVEIVPVEPKKEKKLEKKAKKEEPKPEKNEIIGVEVAAPAPKQVIPVETAIEKKDDVASVEKSSGTVVFDELGDVWTEAKVQKKSKKKSRREN